MPQTTLTHPALPCVTLLATSPDPVDGRAGTGGYVWRRAGSALPKNARVVAMIDVDGTVIHYGDLTPELTSALHWVEREVHAHYRRVARTLEAIVDDLANQTDPTTPHSVDSETFTAIFNAFNGLDDEALKAAIYDGDRPDHPAIRLVRDLLTSVIDISEVEARFALLTGPARAFVLAALLRIDSARYFQVLDIARAMTS